MRRHKCEGGCGRPTPSGLCPTCLGRLPDELRMALDDSEEQYGIDGAVRRWLRQHPEGAR